MTYKETRNYSTLLVHPTTTSWGNVRYTQKFLRAWGYISQDARDEILQIPSDSEEREAAYLDIYYDCYPDERPSTEVEAQLATNFDVGRKDDKAALLLGEGDTVLAYSMDKKTLKKTIDTLSSIYEELTEDDEPEDDEPAVRTSTGLLQMIPPTFTSVGFTGHGYSTGTSGTPIIMDEGTPGERVISPGLSAQAVKQRLTAKITDRIALTGRGITWTK